MTVNGEQIDYNEFFMVQNGGVVGMNTDVSFREYVFLAEDSISAVNTAGLGTCYMYPLAGSMVSENVLRISTTDISSGKWKQTVLSDYFESLSVEYIGDRGSTFNNCLGFRIKATKLKDVRLAPTFVFLNDVKGRMWNGKSFVDVTLGMNETRRISIPGTKATHRLQTYAICASSSSAAKASFTWYLARSLAGTLYQSYFFKDQMVYFSVLDGTEE